MAPSSRDSPEGLPLQLSHAAYRRARGFLLERARPLERALFLRDYEDGSGSAVIDALAAFRNRDGGFGHGLEPDLRLPSSSVLATNHALRMLHEIGAPPDHPFVSGGIAWLLGAYEPALGTWRSVPPEAEQHPHADHWKWALHADGGPWPRAVLPRAEILAQLHRWECCVPARFLADLDRRFLADLAGLDASIGADAIAACEALVQTQAAPARLREATAQRVRELGGAMVSRDPAAWSGYVAKPLKLAPRPGSTLAASLAAEVSRNLDWEIEQQAADGSWLPNWSWGAYPEAWQQARLEWQGDLTLQALRALRAWGRIEPP